MPVLALFDSSSGINAIHLIFARESGLPIKPTNIKAQKINGTILDTYGMVVAAFLMKDKANWVRFFEETFLVANISSEIVLEMPVLTVSRADVNFLGRKLRWKTCTNKKTLSTTRHVELVGKKKFEVALLDSEYETYVFHIRSVCANTLPKISLFDVHSFWKPEISSLTAKEALINIPAKYSDFANVFFPDLASELPKHTAINYYTIKLVEDQQPPHELFIA